MIKKISLLITFLVINTNIFSAIITHDKVNVREKPDTTSSVIFSLNKGKEVWIKEVGKEEKIDKFGSHYWYSVSFASSPNNFSEGWIFGAFLVNKISENRVNLRAEASLESKVIRSLKKGTKVIIHDLKTIIEQEYAEWYYVELPDKEKGWVHSKYVK